MSTTFPPQGRKPKARPKKVVGGRARCKKIALRARHVAAPASSSASSSKSAHVLRAWAPRARVLGLQTSERLGWRPATPASSCHSQRRTPLDPRQRIGHTSQSRAPAPNLDAQLVSAGPTYFTRSSPGGHGPLIRVPDCISSSAWATMPTPRERQNRPFAAAGGRPSSQ